MKIMTTHKKYLDIFVCYLLMLVVCFTIATTNDYSAASVDNNEETTKQIEQVTEPVSNDIVETTTEEVTTEEITTVCATTEEITTTENTTQATEPVKSYSHYTEEDIINLAKVLYAECGSVKSKTEQACVAWVVCNRADYDNCSISQSAKKKGQFAYNPNTRVTDEMYDLAADVLERWSREKDGESNVGRVLPKEYGFFYGDGVRNYFRDKYNGDYNTWDYSLDSPYDT